MSKVNDPPQVLWLDDELGTERQSRLSPWLRPLQEMERLRQIRLTMCNNADDFARNLGRDLPDSQMSTLPRFHLLIIDVMLTEEQDRTFSSMGFPDEQLHPLDAGAQIAGLLRNPTYGEPSRWLAAYSEVPILLLSSSPALNSLVRRKIGRGGAMGIEIVSKRLQIADRDEGIRADPAFVDAVKRSLGIVQ